MKLFNIVVFSLTVLVCGAFADEEKTKYAPDPIDPPKYSYKPDYKPDDYKKPKDTYDSPKDDYEPPSDDYSPDKPDYGNDMPGYGNDKPSYGHAGDKPGYGIDKTGYGYKPSKKPYDTYTPVDHPVCKSKNVCEKKGYKCCACADCNSLSFGCAETCACCPRNAVCCKAGLKNHFCCPRGSQCDNRRGACVTIKKAKAVKADIFCGSCNY